MNQIGYWTSPIIMPEPILYIHLISLGFRTNRSKANIPFKTLNSVQKGSKYKNVKHSHTKLFTYLFKH